MQKKLTPKTIDALPASDGKRYEVRDALLPGLHIRVSSSGGKVFYLSKRVDRQMRRIRIGSYPIISLQDAREKARCILRDIEMGAFQEAEAAEEVVAVPMLGEIIPQFIELYAKPRTKDWKGTRGILTKFADLYSRPIDQIKRTDIVRILDRMVADGTPIRANRAQAAIKKLMNWCVDRGALENSPLTALRPPTKEVSRDRLLSDHELVLCWQAAIQDGYPFGPCLQLLILTGQRRCEVSGMRWSELDLEKAVWTIPATRAKNATAHIVPLAPMAVDLIRSLPKFVGSDLVFTTTGITPISGLSRFKGRLDFAMGEGIPNWRFHDLRRTMATNMAMMRVPPHIIEAVLNHKTGIVSGVAAVYNRHAYADEKREAMEQWAAKVELFAAPRDKTTAK